MSGKKNSCTRQVIYDLLFFVLEETTQHDRYMRLDMPMSRGDTDRPHCGAAQDSEGHVACLTPRAAWGSKPDFAGWT
ncbi:hypothetical protein TNCV_2623191 [Trichonephila clavipes]|nr:hypothetical protein TNCV_2623191 [Trichonephila clavipes]